MSALTHAIIESVHTQYDDAAQLRDALLNEAADVADEYTRGVVDTVSRLLGLDYDGAVALLLSTTEPGVSITEALYRNAVSA